MNHFKIQNMTNVDKALEIISGQAPKTKYRSTAAYNGALEMAKWKDEQFAKQKKLLIDEACNFVATYCFEHPHCKDVLQIEGFGSLDNFLSEMQKALTEFVTLIDNEK